PVENAAFMPMLSLAAFVHSVMIQERRGMLKVWNVFLICLTFFMTIFGTFLTRSGAIASVQSFAQLSIGVYLLPFLAGVAAFCMSLILYRWPELRGLEPKVVHEERLSAARHAVATTLSVLIGLGTCGLVAVVVDASFQKQLAGAPALVWGIGALA